MNAIYRRVLLIDDEKDQNNLNHDLIRHYFRKSPIEIVTFEDPAGGLAYIKKQEKEGIQTILLLDLFMPTLSGWDLLDQLTGTDLSFLDIYLLSSSVNIEDVRRAVAHPLVTGFISKPITGMIESLFSATLFSLVQDIN